MRHILLVLTLVASLLPAGLLAQTPSTLIYCGISLQIDKEARLLIDNEVRKIQGSPTWFKALVDRADVYMPFVQEAFEQENVPRDLTYIAIQESGLRGDVVSKSNAVGFWQFKEPAAREVGLLIDNRVDERMHIYEASRGAARYLKRLNSDFRNWVFAVIGYNRGPAGALSYIDKKYIASRRMPITGKTHWYAIKAIAHKLAYENEIGKGRPGTWIEPRMTEGETSLRKLATREGLDPEELRSYNHWIKGNTLPAQDMVFYVPQTGEPVVASANIAKKPTPAPRQMGSKKAPPKGKVRQVVPEGDPDYSASYVFAGKGESLPEIAVHHETKTAKLREYNDFGMDHRLVEGELVYLAPPSKRKYHIVSDGEKLVEIAKKYDIDFKKLQKKNRMRGQKIYPGQKVYLKKKKPKGEKPIILMAPVSEKPALPAPAKVAPVRPEPPKPAIVRTPTPKPVVAPKKVTKTAPEEPKLEMKRRPPRVIKPATPPAVVKPAPKPVVAEPVKVEPVKPVVAAPAPATKAEYHTVKAGETLWRLSKNHGATVEELQKWNSLNGNAIFEGQKLRVK